MMTSLEELPIEGVVETSDSQEIKLKVEEMQVLSFLLKIICSMINNEINCNSSVKMHRDHMFGMIGN